MSNEVFKRNNTRPSGPGSMGAAHGGRTRTCSRRAYLRVRIFRTDFPIKVLEARPAPRARTLPSPRPSYVRFRHVWMLIFFPLFILISPTGRVGDVKITVRRIVGCDCGSLPCSLISHSGHAVVFDDVTRTSLENSLDTGRIFFCGIPLTAYNDKISLGP